MEKKHLFSKISQSKEGILVLIFLIIFSFMSIISPGKFLSFGNLQSMAYQLPEFGLFSLSMMLVIMTGGINLSMTYSATLGMILGGLFMSTYFKSGGSPILAVIGAIFLMITVAGLCGWFNGWICAVFGVAPMIATLGTSTLFEGICLNITKGGAISGFPLDFISIGNSSVFGIPIPMVIFLLVALLTWLFLERSKLGSAITMVGCSPKVSEFSGVKVRSVLIKTYLISGVLAGLAGIIMASRFTPAKEWYCSSYLLQSVAACVLGGTDIMGGSGTVLGTIVAVLILQTISSGLNIFGLNRYLTTVIVGLVMISVLAINFLMDVRKNRTK